MKRTIARWLDRWLPPKPTWTVASRNVMGTWQIHYITTSYDEAFKRKRELDNNPLLFAFTYYVLLRSQVDERNAARRAERWDG